MGGFPAVETLVTCVRALMSKSQSGSDDLSLFGLLEASKVLCSVSNTCMNSVEKNKPIRLRITFLWTQSVTQWLNPKCVKCRLKSSSDGQGMLYYIYVIFVIMFICLLRHLANGSFQKCGVGYRVHSLYLSFIH